MYVDKKLGGVNAVQTLSRTDPYRKITHDSTFGDVFRRVMFERIVKEIGSSTRAAQ